MALMIIPMDIRCSWCEKRAVHDDNGYDGYKYALAAFEENEGDDDDGDYDYAPAA
ncbi:hypothetical protein CDL12_06114 [Handroanthus impetiginosus]|uniref:Uncharacterized protein n=1 Tax=Handroanthus impetiginosus TaxID=429701 RepID=A0A2G9HUQ6_9LAMI|nr:hypothetical protein CDL12_06114 [Handroanthus impetiginosus]